MNNEFIINCKIVLDMIDLNTDKLRQDIYENLKTKVINLSTNTEEIQTCVFQIKNDGKLTGFWIYNNNELIVRRKFKNKMYFNKFCNICISHDITMTLD